MKHMYQRISLTLAALSLLLLPVTAGDASLTWDDVYCFSAGDLSAVDARGIIVTGIPEESLGTVKLSARTIRAGDVLTAETIDQLTFIPSMGTEGQAVISCITITEDGLGEEAEMTLKIGSGKNEAPVAADSDFETYKNISAEIPLSVTDKESDAYTVNIITPPKRGTVSVDQEGTVTYIPEENKVGKDSFTYTVTDAAGNTSNEATVRLQILKPSHKETYADMLGSDGLLAATWLREMDIFSGETVSGNALFHPDETLTRGEFIAMCAALTGTEPLEPAKTGFLDQETTASWLKPYVSEAVKCGYLTGIPTQEGLMLLSEQQITRGEAAVMASSLLALPEAQAENVMAEDTAVPAWAATAVSAALEAGIFDATESNALLTRKDAAMLLHRIYFTAKENAEEITMLSWAKD